MISITYEKPIETLSDKELQECNSKIDSLISLLQSYKVNREAVKTVTITIQKPIESLTLKEIDETINKLKDQQCYINRCKQELELKLRKITVKNWLDMWLKCSLNLTGYHRTYSNFRALVESSSGTDEERDYEYAGAYKGWLYDEVIKIYEQEKNPFVFTLDKVNKKLTWEKSLQDYFYNFEYNQKSNHFTVTECDGKNKKDIKLMPIWEMFKLTGHAWEHRQKTEEEQKSDKEQFKREMTKYMIVNGIEEMSEFILKNENNEFVKRI